MVTSGANIPKTNYGSIFSDYWGDYLTYWSRQKEKEVKR